MGSMWGTIQAVVLLNMTSACSDENFAAFCKLKAVSTMLNDVNNFIIMGGVSFLGIITMPFKIGILFLNPLFSGASDTNDPLFYARIVSFAMFMGVWLFTHTKTFRGITPGTYAVLFGGLMSDVPIAPAGKDPETWGTTATTEEVESYVYGRVVEKALLPAPEKNSATLAMYRERTAAKLRSRRTGIGNSISEADGATTRFKQNPMSRGAPGR